MIARLVTHLSTAPMELKFTFSLLFLCGQVQRIYKQTMLPPTKTCPTLRMNFSLDINTLFLFFFFFGSSSHLKTDSTYVAFIMDTPVARFSRGLTLNSICLHCTGMSVGMCPLKIGGALVPKSLAKAENWLNYHKKASFLLIFAKSVVPIFFLKCWAKLATFGLRGNTDKHMAP